MVSPHSPSEDSQDKRQHFNLALQGSTHFGPSYFSNLIWTFTSCHLYALATLAFFHVPFCHMTLVCAVLSAEDALPHTYSDHIHSPSPCKYDGALPCCYAAFITVTILHLFDF